MATKLIIVFPMRDSRAMPPIGRFRRSNEHDAHIWDGRVYDTSCEEDMAEFNATILPALSLMDTHPTKAVVRAIYEAPVLAESDEAPPIPHDAPMPRKRHARMKPGLVTA